MIFKLNYLLIVKKIFPALVIEAGYRVARIARPSAQIFNLFTSKNQFKTN